MLWSRSRLARRLAGALTALAMLQLGALLPARCEAHPATPGPGHAARTAQASIGLTADAHAGHDMPATAAPGEHLPEQEHCNEGAPRECCVGLTSCSLDVRVDVVSTDVALSFDDAHAPPTLTRPHSLVTAPEPPPPRA